MLTTWAWSYLFPAILQNLERNNGFILCLVIECKMVSKNSYALMRAVTGR